MPPMSFVAYEGAAYNVALPDTVQYILRSELDCSGKGLQVMATYTAGVGALMCDINPNLVSVAKQILMARAT